MWKFSGALRSDSGSARLVFDICLVLQQLITSHHCSRCPWWRGGARICLRGRWLGCPTLEKKLIMSACCCGPRAASRSAVARWSRVGRRHEWHRSRGRPVWVFEAPRCRRWPTAILIPSSSHKPRAGGMDIGSAFFCACQRAPTNC